MTADAIPTIISPTLEVTGDLESDGEVQVEGMIRGNLRAGAVQVGRRGTVEGMVEADEVVVYGRVGGGIRAASLDLAESATVEGEIRFGRMTVAGGASIEGRIGRLGAATRTTGTTVSAGPAGSGSGVTSAASPAVDPRDEGLAAGPDHGPLAGSIDAPIQQSPDWDIIGGDGGDGGGESGESGGDGKGSGPKAA